MVWRPTSCTKGPSPSPEATTATGNIWVANKIEAIFAPKRDCITFHWHRAINKPETISKIPIVSASTQSYERVCSWKDIFKNLILAICLLQTSPQALMNITWLHQTNDTAYVCSPVGSPAMHRSHTSAAHSPWARCSHRHSCSAPRHPQCKRRWTPMLKEQVGLRKGLQSLSGCPVLWLLWGR